ncbi:MULTISPECIES: hypothetical protein [Flavobacterium]|uniref:hypothetical protein n=1 Tax=Flavobacterium TaxID=237 RepID=UPI001FCBDEEA|nr:MULTISPECIES: hypothetical protein [Flavobacterium]UOK41252.1 hypothetical protein LZF87_07925 [Flavobacterium enshiense]
MNEKVLHIVSFDNPYPPNYGGVIDVFYKLKALHSIGFAIHLHCFVKEIPSEFDELEKLCKSIYFYEITNSPFHFFSALPFSVISRGDRRLAENIAKTEAPILFEGLKTTCSVYDSRIKNHRKILRLQNIEEDYFNGISKSENSLLKKIAFKLEAMKYTKYKDVFSKFDEVITLSKFENEKARQFCEKSTYVPVFHGNDTVLPLEGFGEYSIYHGDLNTSDNRKCVVFLIDVFRKLPHRKLVIASGSNEDFVQKLIGGSENIQFVKLNDFEQLKTMLQKSHISISWSFQKSGTKLKAINSLFNTRFCIINENIIDDTVVSDLCVTAKNDEELIAQIEALSEKSFSDYPRRKEVLENYMSDTNNALKIEKLICHE